MASGRGGASASQSNLVQYEEWTPDDAVGAAEETAAASEAGGYWKLKAGDNVVRFLPTKRGMHLHPLVETWNHYIQVPGKEKGVGFNCFSGSTRFWANGELHALRDLVGETVEVLAKDRVWRSAEVSSFGVQRLQRVVMHAHHAKTAAFSFEVTADHRWFTANRGEVTDLRVGDRVRVEVASYADKSDDPAYRAGFVHGLVFADGSRGSKGGGHFQLRMCGEKARHLDAVRGDSCWRSDSRPPSFRGDPVAQLQSDRDLKRVPPSHESMVYQAGFLAGWLALDGSQGDNADTPRGAVDLSTQDASALAWAVERAPLLGWCVMFVGTPRDNETNYGPRSAPLTTARFRPEATEYVVRAIVDEGREEEVFCVTEPVTGGFTLEYGVPTGNCPRKMKAGWICPACVRVEELRGTGNPADYNAAGDYLAKLRVYAWIIDRNDEGAGPQKFAFGKTIYEPLMAYRSRNPKLDVPFTSVTSSGCDVVIKKTGEKMKTKYGVRLVNDRGPLSDDSAQVKEWMDAVTSLAGETRVLSVREIEKLLAGEGGDDDDRGGRGGGRPRPGAGTSRQRSVVDDSDESSDDAGAGYEPHPDD